MHRSHRRRPLRWVPALAALAVAPTLLAACGSGGSADAGSAAAAPRSGGTLTFAVGSDAGCVDPQQVGSNDTIYSMRQLVDSLTDQDPRTGAIVPWLARSWEISPDARTFTFHLRPGATFSDGAPVDAHAVKATFDAVPHLGVLGQLAVGYLSGYTGTTVVDDLTARVGFAQPNAQFLQASSTFSLGLVSPASAAKTPQQRCSQGVAGSGSFTLAKYVPGQSITLTRRAGYGWGSSLWAKKGEAYLDSAVFRIVPESGVRTGSLVSGQLDAIGSVGRADEAALRGAGVALQARANPGVVFGLSLNNSRPLLGDARVRQAILFAVNRGQIADTVFPTGTRPATSVLAHTTPYYTDLGAQLRFDQARARALLDEAGWRAGPDGVRSKDGVPLRLTITWGPVAATNQPALELVQQQLRAVGVTVVLHQIPISQFGAIQRTSDFDALWGNITRADPDILRTSFSTTLLNTYRLAPSELDTVLTDQAAQPDPTKRRALVDRAQRLIVANAYTVPVVELQTELGVSKKVHGLAFEASSRIQLHDTWK
ncbi:ABC transporter substrate-binding protein, partial [Frankia tisae]